MPRSEIQQETEIFCAVLWPWRNAESMQFTASSELMQILENFICLSYPWHQCVSIALKTDNKMYYSIRVYFRRKLERCLEKREGISHRFEHTSECSLPGNKQG